MSHHSFTTLEKLGEIEKMIEETRALNHAPGTDFSERLDLLKAIAADLRGRLEIAPSVALVQIERRLTLLARRTDAADRMNAKVGAAEELVARWPTVKQALEQFDETVKKETA